MHKENRSSELIATSIKDSCDMSEALGLIHIGLLCVQRRSEDRPSMSSVVLMMGGRSALTQPKQLGFFTERDIIEDKSSSADNHNPCSPNTATITLLEPR
ncbi:conserved hypothetical protein [Ricinus communis]|uniref:S-locus receptor kinase C-terminal domain-containing protein n=1 Tax=Ricinus communis TaxID=3988 RepID=B9S0R8_RICCO|nr:conserved hypothetical protein [Ricinus communis]